MDLSSTIIPRSDQLNADDLMAGPRTVTIVQVVEGSTEQPVNIITAEYGKERPYKPSKSMRRVLVAAWGPEASAYAGRRLTIYRDPTIKFGGDEVGGIRISHLSHIDKPMKIALMIARGKRAPYVVQPLPDAPDRHDWATEVQAATTEAELREIWERSDKTNEISALIKARKAELSQPVPDPETGELPMDGPMFNEGGTR